jgi:hypothetical protein
VTEQNTHFMNREQKREKRELRSYYFL